MFSRTHNAELAQGVGEKSGHLARHSVWGSGGVSKQRGENENP